MKFIFATGVTFDTENIVYHAFSNGNKTITKTNITGPNEGVFMNTTVENLPMFSVRLARNAFGCCLCIGMALSESHFTQEQKNGSWCIGTSTGAQYSQGLVYQSSQWIAEGSNVTVAVDFCAKQISYRVNGVSAGPARDLNLTDSQMLQLRPLVQIYYIGDILEIMP